MNGSPPQAPIKAKNGGTSSATDVLLSSEMATSVAMLPPSMAVMTGAAVAVGHRAHIMAPWASSTLQGAMAR